MGNFIYLLNFRLFLQVKSLKRFSLSISMTSSSSRPLNVNLLIFFLSLGIESFSDFIIAIFGIYHRAQLLESQIFKNPGHPPDFKKMKILFSSYIGVVLYRGPQGCSFYAIPESLMAILRYFRPHTAQVASSPQEGSKVFSSQNCSPGAPLSLKSRYRVIGAS